jgi:hypothetical protein
MKMHPKKNMVVAQEKIDDSQGNANVTQPHYENEYLDLTVLHENAIALHS